MQALAAWTHTYMYVAVLLAMVRPADAHSVAAEARVTSQGSTAASAATGAVTQSSGAEQSRVTKSPKGAPNFFLVMCDDLDKKLGGEGAIPQVHKLIGEGGADAANYFVSSPKCTPSRAAWLSGRHYHNLRPHGARVGPGLNTSNLFDEDAVFPTLRKAGYQTAIFGKIHNDQGRWLCTPENHTEPFDHIETECGPCGGYYRTGPDEWVHKETHGDVTVLETLDPADPFSNYSEAQYGNRTVRWIRKIVAAKQEPFFAFIGTSGPHLGVIPAPWHREMTANLKGSDGQPIQAPRNPAFNYHAKDHHPLLATAPILDEKAIADEDMLMRDRWGTLFSIDDMVVGVADAIKELGIADRTYMLFTSDHGYHLGQFRIPDEKMMPYDTDIRVPFYIAGPGIKPGTKLTEMVSNIDIGPTLCELAGITPPPLMDGRSMVDLVTGKPANLKRPWRTHFMTEFAEGGFQQWGTNGMWDYAPGGAAVDVVVRPPWGPGCMDRAQCVNNTCGMANLCPEDMRHDYQYDDPSYNWRALRVINATDDFTFVQWDEKYVFGDGIDPGGIQFSEYYDLKMDEWQLNNLWPTLPKAKQEALKAEIAHRFACTGTRTTPSNCE